MNPKASAKSVLVLIVIGTLISAQQARAESVFSPKGFDSLKASATGTPMPASGPAPASSPSALSWRSFAADTVETFEVEIEKDKGPGLGRQLAVFAIVTAVVGYSVIVLMKSDDAPAKTTKRNGKDPNPFSVIAGISAAITR
jgi:hypothetical protein